MKGKVIIIKSIEKETETRVEKDEVGKGRKRVLSRRFATNGRPLEGQQAEITIPFLISNDDTESLWSRRYNDYSEDTRFAVGKG